MTRGGLAKYSDGVLAAFVIAITVMLVIPLPTIALDLLLTLNIGLAVLLLLVGLYVPNALSLLAFPSLLLLSTLFRLSLNVASTRLILSNGDAGRVIEAFGTFLISGEIVVGIIIFIIVTVVNFVVIARGAGRVSEVAARFALDALPGKQMAIDSDLRSGLINAQEAQEKRSALRKESQLYGAMDGAMKFVQGDAIAGLFITCTNIVGGMYMGIAEGMGISEAAETYTTLTVGDGLVSQIPALLISICAGIVVTRVSASERSTLGRDLGVQLFKKPSLLVLTGCILLIMMLLSDLPWLPFTVVIALCFGMAFSISSSRTPEHSEYPVGVEPYTQRIGMAPAIENIDQTLDEDHIELVLDDQVLFKLYERKRNDYSAWWRKLQNDFFQAVGLELPPLRVVSDSYLSAGSYRVRKASAVVEHGEVLLDSILVEMNPHCARVFGLRILREEEHPLRGDRIFWTRATLAATEILRAARIRYFDFFEFIAIKTARFIQESPEEVLSLIDIHAKLKALEKQYPGFVSDALYSKGINATQVAEIIHALIRSGLSIREFKGTLEAIASYVVDSRSASDSEVGLSVDQAVEHVRYMRRRQLIGSSLSARSTVKVFTLAAEVETVFEDLEYEARSSSLAIAPEQYLSLESGLEQVVNPFKERGLLPISVLCRREIRSWVNKFLLECHVNLPVLSFEELDASLPIESVGVWSLQS